MPIGTSNGDYYEDEFDKAHTEMFGVGGTYDKKTDTFVADTEPTPKEIYLVRHGDTDLNKEGEKSNDRAPVRGWSNTPLNAQGRADAEKAAEKLSKEPITHIVTSDLPRASETASIIGNKLGITPEEHPGLRTWNLGEYTGKTGKEVHDAVDNLCLHAPDTRPPGGESFNEFKDRILSTFGEISKDHAEHEVLVVSHNSPERILNAWHEAGQPASGEIDRKQYHSDEGSINPGEHKKFTIENPDDLMNTPMMGLRRDEFEGRFRGTGDWGGPQSDTFRQRFEGEPGKLPLQGPAFDINKMPDWWVRKVNPTTKWPGEGPQFFGPEPKGIFPYPQNWIMPYDPGSPSDKTGPMQVSMKDRPTDPKHELEAGGAGTRIGSTTTKEPLLGTAESGFEWIPRNKLDQGLKYNPKIVPDEPILERDLPGRSPRYKQEKAWRLRNPDYDKKK